MYSNNLTFGSRWNQKSGGNGLSGVYTFGYKDQVGAYELYIGAGYKENQLMLAEANVRLGNLNTGLAFLDAVRAYQGAGIAAVAGTGLTATQAVAEVVRERRVAFVYRGVSFLRQPPLGMNHDIAKGGGVYGANVLVGTSNLNTNVTVNYNFLDYWDVPADEADLNPPAAGSAPVKNPN